MMSSRFRWYQVKLPKAVQDLADIIKERPLRENSISGFSQYKDELGSPKIRFLWRTKVVVTRFDDAGIPSYEEIATINFTDFAIVTVEDMTFLRVENPGRNSRDLLNAIESLVGIGFIAKPLLFDKAKPTTIFSSVDAAKLVGLKVVGAVVGEDLVARMEFASKKGMVIENMEVLNGLRYTVDSAVFELTFQGVRGQIAFTSSGLVKISGPLTPYLVGLVERDLPMLFSIA